jgi:hypothetical protein
MSLPSLALVLCMPDDLVAQVASYLSFKDWGFWRQTHRRAFTDVETLIRKEAFIMEQRYHVTVIQEPCSLKNKSAWYQFMCNVYQCKMCWQYDSAVSRNYTSLDYVVQHAQEEQLCGWCYLDTFHLTKCVVCRFLCPTLQGVTCHYCHSFYCADCNKRTEMQPCYCGM